MGPSSSRPGSTQTRVAFSWRGCRSEGLCVTDVDRWPCFVDGRQGWVRPLGSSRAGLEPGSTAALCAPPCVRGLWLGRPGLGSVAKNGGGGRLCSLLPRSPSVCLSLPWESESSGLSCLPPHPQPVTGASALVPSRVSKTTCTLCSAWPRTRWGPRPRGQTTSTCCTQESEAAPQPSPPTGPSPSCGPCGWLSWPFPGPTGQSQPEPVTGALDNRPLAPRVPARWAVLLGEALVPPRALGTSPFRAFCFVFFGYLKPCTPAFPPGGPPAPPGDQPLDASSAAEGNSKITAGSPGFRVGGSPPPPCAFGPGPTRL